MAARQDNVSDPVLADMLLLARRGQAYFSRKLRDLRDKEFDAPSLLPGWSRRHVIAHVGYNARAIARLVEWAATGIEQPMYASPAQRLEEIDLGATQSVDALRNLSDHAAAHLNVEWRDLPEPAWEHQVRTAQGRWVPARETAWMRAREVWLHALDLDNGGSVEHFPRELVDLLLEDLVQVWRRKQSPDILLMPDDRPATYRVSESAESIVEAAGTLVVHGSAAALMSWGVGRGGHGVTTADGRPAPPAPAWL